MSLTKNEDVMLELAALRERYQAELILVLEKLPVREAVRLEREGLLDLDEHDAAWRQHLELIM